MAEFLNQKEIDSLLKIAEKMGVDNLPYDIEIKQAKKRNKKEDKWLLKPFENNFCDILVENIPIEYAQEIIFLANKLKAQSAIINFKDN